MRKPGKPGSVIVPVHARDLKRGTLAKILRSAGMSREKFLELLR